ncbi:MAG: NACHT domain-containing protein [Proteobacteria bacterium]|nr:NACHT domain-containing protein [Pseudomonadota bacterium]
MTSEGTVDVNKIIADISVRLIENTVTGGGRLVANFVKNNKLDVQQATGKYLSKTEHRVRFVKTLFSDDPVDLNDLYVPISFEKNGSILQHADLVYEIENKRRIVISGIAGGGKSMFTRKYCLDTIYAKENLPVYIELRLVSPAIGNLSDSISKELLSALPGAGSEVAQALMEKGKIVAILDGFDEVSQDNREWMAREIDGLAVKFPSMKIVVTSRPNEGLSAWKGFSLCRVQPMSKASAIELLNNIQFDMEIKSAFISEVDATLYMKHRDFLSNPLLCTLMLVAYRQFAEIPDKVYLFYQFAFEALFRRHDTSKDGVFKRDLASGLQYDEFQRLFSYFCAKSYALEQFGFYENDFIKYIIDSIAYENLSCTMESCKFDLLETVCLILRDGLEYKFVHRSFQEYFAALFLVNSDGKSLRLALDHICHRMGNDNVVAMAYQMNPALLEKEWLLPKIEKIWSLMKSIDPEREPQKIFELLYENATVEQNSLRISLDWENKNQVAFYITLLVGERGVKYSEEEKKGHVRIIVNQVKKVLKEDEYIRSWIEKRVKPNVFKETMRTGRIQKLEERIADIPQPLFRALLANDWATRERQYVSDAIEILRARVDAREIRVLEIFDRPDAAT